MNFTTERLRLRPWKETDAKSLYTYAKNPLVGPQAGWPVHTSIENSRDIIKTVLLNDETYAVCLKSDGKAIGSIGLKGGESSGLSLPDTEREIGYWIGVPFWGQGLIPEAVTALLQYSFEQLKLEKMWCCYFDGNEKSKRVQEKCGFQYQYTKKDVYWNLIDQMKTVHFTCLTKEDWKKQKW